MDHAVLSPANLTLHEWACIRTELIWAYRHPPLSKGTVSLCDHRHGNWAWYFERGYGWVKAPSGRLDASAGMWMIPPREKAERFFSEDCSIISIHFDCQWPSGLEVIASTQGLVIPDEAFPELLRRGRRLERMVRKHFPGDAAAHTNQPTQCSDFDLFLRFQAEFLNWMAGWYCVRVQNGARLSRRQTDDHRALRVLRCLNTALIDGGYPRKELVAAAGLSEVHLNRVFLRAYGISPRKFWDSRQLQVAKRLLETSNAPVKEIAFGIGFRSVSHFVVWFRRFCGLSPGVFREQAAQARRD
jgi:AraC-like DNA-binding protein